MRRLFRNRQGVVGCEATPDQLTIAHVAAGKRPTVQALHQVPNPGLSVSALRNLAAMAAQAPAMALLLAADNDSVLNATYHRELCLNRAISLGTQDLSEPQETPDDDTGNLALESQSEMRLDSMGLEGSFNATARYIRALENSEWRIYWDNMAFEIDQYPRGKVSIRLFTLSSEEGWLSV